MAKKKITISGKKKKNNKIVNGDLEYQLDEGISAEGTAVSDEVFKDLLKPIFTDASTPANAKIAYIFGRQSLMLILSQNLCQGIAFCKCINPESKEESIVGYGVRADGYPLNWSDASKKLDTSVALLAVEWVQGKTLNELKPIFDPNSALIDIEKYYIGVSKIL